MSFLPPTSDFNSATGILTYLTLLSDPEAARSRLADLAKTTKEATDAMDKLRSAQQDMENREKDLASREADLVQKSLALDSTQANLDKATAALDTKQSTINNSVATVAAKNKSLDDREQKLNERETSILVRDQASQQQAIQLTAKSQELDKVRSILEDKLNRLKAIVA